MASIRATETKPEVLLRKALWHAGIRGYRKYPKLPGKPDLLFTQARVAVFVDGCFWHGCPNHLRVPKSNLHYWPAKIESNKQRDMRVNDELTSLGFHVLRVWEHDVESDIESVIARVKVAIDRDRH